VQIREPNFEVPVNLAAPPSTPMMQHDELGIKAAILVLVPLLAVFVLYKFLKARRCFELTICDNTKGSGKQSRFQGPAVKSSFNVDETPLQISSGHDSPSTAIPQKNDQHKDADRKTDDPSLGKTSALPRGSSFEAAFYPTHALFGYGYKPVATHSLL